VRLLAFRRRDGSAGLGAERDGAIVDLTARVGTDSMRVLLSSDDGLARARQAADSALELDPAGLQLDLPVPDAGRILCVGVNYAHRNAEYRDGAELPAYPSLFFRTAASFVPHDAALVRPRESLQLDYEGEIALVIGRAGRRIAPEAALQHVAGLTLVNEGTVRDWVRHGKFNVTQGKNFDRSGAMGPWIETGLDALDLERLPIETRVNGELRQADTTA
jgi:2-keto-4-pentenoate hydratase/2-oxohepta-3-ene-1,7-dioic acid hydratase in catechol pathway